MTSLYSTSGYVRGRLVVVPGAAPDFDESVPQAVDPPIFRAMLRHWASCGRTLPGRRDQEWTRLAAAPVWARPADVPGEVSRSRGLRGDGR
ncbi:hypothetical protein [Streptomyces sp. TRM49041]|uniref:hypothetical protein n=1 Tax=Streptomyces sp. TRM49041 TaxID=2603216 RepID=UPI0011EC09B5|nr:hypothetical protein [Streptomyces sp. TRM49041]